MRFNVFLPRGAWRFLGPTLVFTSGVGHAAPPPALSLPAALAYAQAHEPGLQAARERLRAAQQEAEVPGAQWRPSFGALAEFVEGTSNNSTATPLGASAVDLPRIGGTAVSDRAQWRPEATTLLAFGARQELYDFGRIAAQSAAARALAAISESEVRHTQLDLRLAVTNAYYAVRAAHALLEIATQAEARAAVYRDLARAAVHSGLRPPVEVTRADADVTRFEVARIRAQGSLVVSRGVFAAAVGYEQPELEASDEVPDEPRFPSRASAEERAVGSDPAVQEAVGRVRAEHALAEAVSASLRPNLSASAAISLRAGGAAASNDFVPDGRGFVPNVPNYSAGIVFNWPFFEPVTQARVRALRAREHALSDDVEVARQRAFSRVRQAYEAMALADASLAALEKSEQAARANHEQAEGRFRAGLGTALELADAETLRLNAEVERVIGRFQAATARAELERAIGSNR
ncbi:MAG TPA: TolC family protein [Polyangiaceae bacterium]|nr:TolC family protein [Polyangiaceae bacterium]